jgi:hypothetical protein
MRSKNRLKQVRAYRGQIPSPGRPSVAWREDRVRFGAAIASGVKTRDAGVAAGVSEPVAHRWFLHAGGVNPRPAPTLSGRYLSSSDRGTLRCGGRRAGGAGNSSAAGPKPVDDLAGAAPKRVYENVSVGLQGEATVHGPRGQGPSATKLIRGLAGTIGNQGRIRNTLPVSAQQPTPERAEVLRKGEEGTHFPLPQRGRGSGLGELIPA